MPGAAWPQGNPLGTEFRVNTYTNGHQVYPSVASDSSGNFVVVWHGPGKGGSGNGVFAQRYVRGGVPLGLEFRVNTYTTDSQWYPSVARDPSGAFVVVWMGGVQDGSGYGIFGQRYAASGGPLGPEFRVNTYTTSIQAMPSVAADGSGNFVVVWESSTQDGAGRGVFGQRYVSSGVPLGPEFRVNTYTTSDQANPAVANDPLGGFVVAWASFGQDGSAYGIFGQRYAASGAPLGPEFRVNTYTTSFQDLPAVTSDSAGNFVVAWHSYGQDGASVGVFGQRYASSGTPLGPEFRVNAYTTGIQAVPSVAADDAGNFVIVWYSFLQDGDGQGVFGQRYAGSGVPLGPEFRVNTYTTGGQALPSVAADAGGDFVVVWECVLQDGSGYGVFGQRYSAIVPVELMRFGVE